MSDHNQLSPFSLFFYFVQLHNKFLHCKSLNDNSSHSAEHEIVKKESSICKSFTIKCHTQKYIFSSVKTFRCISLWKSLDVRALYKEIEKKSSLIALLKIYIRRTQLKSENDDFHIFPFWALSNFFFFSSWKKVDINVSSKFLLFIVVYLKNEHFYTLLMDKFACVYIHHHHHHHHHYHCFVTYSSHQNNYCVSICICVFVEQINSKRKQRTV